MCISECFYYPLQGSHVECDIAKSLLKYSIPKPCHTAINDVNGSLADASMAANAAYVCRPYCLTPLKQAAQDCQDIAAIFNVISVRCCRNSEGKRFIFFTIF